MRFDTTLQRYTKQKKKNYDILIELNTLFPHGTCALVIFL